MDSEPIFDDTVYACLSQVNSIMTLASYPGYYDIAMTLHAAIAYINTIIHMKCIIIATSQGGPIIVIFRTNDQTSNL